MQPPGIQFGVKASALSADPREAAIFARKLGFAGLQFDAFSAGLAIPDLSITGRREFRHVLSSQDQQVVGLVADLGRKGVSLGADIDRVLRDLERVFEAAAGLLAPLVCLDIGPLPEPPRVVKPRPKVTQAQAGLILLPEQDAIANEPQAAPVSPPPDPKWVSQTDSALFEIGRRADRFGVMVAFRTELASFAALDAALRKASCPWFGIDLDPPAILADAWSIDTIFSTLANQIRHVRGRDAIAGTDHRTKPAPIGQGDIDWPHLLNTLDAAGYRGWLTIDPVDLNDRTGAAHAGLKHLTK